MELGQNQSLQILARFSRNYCRRRDTLDCYRAPSVAIPRMKDTAIEPRLWRQTTKNAVRVRTQSAEEVMRTIVVNGKTAPARIAQLSAETDGRIEYIGADRGANLERGNLIVRMDERDRVRHASPRPRRRVKQREVEYEARARLKSESYVSEAQLQEALALLESARAELTRAELDLAVHVRPRTLCWRAAGPKVEIGDFRRARRSNRHLRR